MANHVEREITDDEITAHYERLRAHLNSKQRLLSVLAWFFQRLLTHRSGPGVSAKDLATDLKIPAETLKSYVSDLRHEVILFEESESEDSVHFEVDSGRSSYRLIVRPKEAAKPPEFLQFLPRHRANANMFRSLVCGKWDDLLMLTITPDQLRANFEAWLDTKSINAKCVRVLIWQPSAADVCDAVAFHLGENAGTFADKAYKELGKWEKLRDDRSGEVRLEVRPYRGVPTMTATMIPDRIKVEFLPFNYREGENLGTHLLRPALIAYRSKHPEAYETFKAVLEDLWKSGEGSTP